MFFETLHKKGLEKEADVMNEMLGLTTTANKFAVRTEKPEIDMSGTTMYNDWKFTRTTGGNVTFRITSEKVPCLKKDPVDNITSPVPCCFRMGGTVISIIKQ